MGKINHFYYLLTTLISSLFLAPFSVLQAYQPVQPDMEAPAVDTGGNTIANSSGLGTQDPIDVTSMIINWILTFLGLIFLCLIIYGGFRWMLAQGNEEEITKAKNIIKGAVIGLIIILISYGATALIFNVMANITQ